MPPRKVWTSCPPWWSLNHNLGDGYEYWENFYEFHKLAYDELEAFDYEEFKKNGFEVKRLGDVPLPPDPKM